ncbi:MAG TPA: hypothetical protein VLV50_15045, partial [Stellaceae bacterium]|nr:hypothetical protein [Stellaceae bacterium]
MERLLAAGSVARSMQRHLPQQRRDPLLALARQQLPNRRRQIAHRGIRANAPGHGALQRRFSAIRPPASIYERHHKWDIEEFFGTLKTAGFDIENADIGVPEVMINFVAAATVAAVTVMQLV